MGIKESIGWCDNTVNVCWGCKNSCPYCISRRIARHRGAYIGWKRDYDINIITKMVNFQPVVFPDKERIFNAKVKGKAKTFFMNMMSDIADWDKELNIPQARVARHV